MSLVFLCLDVCAVSTVLLVSGWISFSPDYFACFHYSVCSSLFCGGSDWRAYLAPAYVCDVLQVNAFILHEYACGQTPLREQLEFRLRLVDQMLALGGARVGQPVRKRRVVSPVVAEGAVFVPPAPPADAVGNHIITAAPATHCGQNYHACCFCSVPTKRVRTGFYCSSCLVYLCAACFAPYHSQFGIH